MSAGSFRGAASLGSIKMPQVVDLTLAVNYLPACACLCKVVLLMSLIGLIQPGDEVRGGYIPLAAVLYFDRVVARNLIFDANAILLAVYFANVHAAVRSASQRQTYWFFLWGLHLCWIGMCLVLIYEPSRVRWIFEKRVQASRLVPIFMMLLVIVGTSYTHATLEPAPYRGCRAMAFTLLAFTWIYVVGIHAAHGLDYLKETSSQFVVRLAPVLYSPPWLAALFLVAAVVGLVLQYSRRFDALDVGSLESNPKAAQQQEEPPPPQTSQQDETQQLHELFRQARLSSRLAHQQLLEPVSEEKGFP